MRNIAILASGEGTNAEQIIRYFAQSDKVHVSLLMASKPGIGAIRRAGNLQVPVEVAGRQDFVNGRALAVLQQYQIDFVVLAGFLLHIPDDVLRTYPRRIINIHPSLLPLHGGKGMYGHHVHQDVLDCGDKESGITVHYVNERYDAGDIIFQTKCPVVPGDTPDSLAERVHQLEHRYFPEVIEEVVSRLP